MYRSYIFNNVITNHKTITDDLIVKTFTGWNTEFPVVFNQKQKEN